MVMEDTEEVTEDTEEAMVETDTTAIMAEDMVKIIYFIRSKQLNRQYTGRPYGYGGGYGGYGGYGGPSISVYPG